MNDLISRDDAIEAIQNAYCKPCKERGDDYNEVRCRACEYDNAIIQIDALPSADATKKKAELKENGDWDCPDVDCEECEHIRSVKWCSLAIPNYEEKIDETYKMVHEAFFEGFNAAEERYKFLIEYVEELDKKSVEAENRHYIKIYADDEPSVKAEKLYQICGETQNREVAEWLKEYFPLSYDN